MITVGLRRLRSAPWRRLVALTRRGFVFRVTSRSALRDAGFGALSWTGFYVCQDAPTIECAAAHLALNREVIRRLRANRGRS